MNNRNSLILATIVAFGFSLAVAAPAAARHGGGGGHPAKVGKPGKPGKPGRPGRPGRPGKGVRVGVHFGGFHGGGVHGQRRGGHYRNGIYVVDGGAPVVYGGSGSGCNTTRSVAFLPSGLRRITTTKVCIVP